MPEFCERFQGRNDLLEYAKNNNIPVAATMKAPWSMDANIMHISYESGILEDPSTPGPEELYQMTRNPQNGPNTPIRLDIVFNQGIPVRCSNSSTGNSYEQPLHILQYLNQIGGKLLN